MNNSLKFSVLILICLFSCRNVNDNKSNAGKVEIDSNTGFRDTADIKKQNSAGNSAINGLTNAKGSRPDAKTIEVEVVRLSRKDTIHKMTLFHSDQQYFRNDSLYCELLYKLKEVELAAKSALNDGDYVSMIIDGRPQGQEKYYQIGLYRIRKGIDKTDRIDSYRINIKTRLIERRDAVKDKWIEVKNK